MSVDKIAVSDGCILEAHDLIDSSQPPRPRLQAHLSDTYPPDELWWLSTRVHLPQPRARARRQPLPGDDNLLHPKYQLPARCFAYVGHPQRPATWKLPYLRRDGTVDERRLPKAIRRCYATTVASRYACQNHGSPGVLARLAQAAARQGRMPHQDPTPAAIYQALQDTLIQLGCHDQIASLTANTADKIRQP